MGTCAELLVSQPNMGQLFKVALLIVTFTCVQASLAVPSSGYALAQKSKPEKAKKKDQALCGSSPRLVSAESQLNVVNLPETDRAGGQVVKKVTPAYPARAVAARVEGRVIVDAVVSTTGEVGSVKSASGPSPLTEASTEAALKWRFTPTTVSGEPREVLARITFLYVLGLPEKTQPANAKKKSGR